MPDYDFRCKACGHTFTVTTGSVDEIDALSPTCPQCDSDDLSRLIQRVGILTSEETRMERLMDPSRLAGLDEDDPRAMGRLMREMAGELGEDADPEMHEVIDRLEAGESPDSIEQSLDLGGDEGPGVV
ncbi:MAG TPA: zinc ribbon domain-containing protein [Aggregatilineales bacterium]|nr:zinc ribbon domain-containing protein [Aggregatilineales bacterium]